MPYRPRHRSLLLLWKRRKIKSISVSLRAFLRGTLPLTSPTQRTLSEKLHFICFSQVPAGSDCLGGKAIGKHLSIFSRVFPKESTLSLTSSRSCTKRKATLRLLLASTDGLRLPLFRLYTEEINFLLVPISFLFRNKSLLESFLFKMKMKSRPAVPHFLFFLHGFSLLQLSLTDEF